MSTTTEVCRYCGTQFLRPDDRYVSETQSLERVSKYNCSKPCPAEFIVFVPANGHLFRDVGDDILHVCHYGVEFRRAS